jgi:hypothetical protein
LYCDCGRARGGAAEKEALLGARRRASPCRCGNGGHSPSNSIKSSAQQRVSLLLLLLLRFAEDRVMGEAGGDDGAVARGREELHETSVLFHHARATNHGCNEGLGDRQSFNVDEPSTKIIMQGCTLRSWRLGLFQGHLSRCGDATAGFCIEPRRGTRRTTGLWEMLWEEFPLSQVT